MTAGANPELTPAFSPSDDALLCGTSYSSESNKIYSEKTVVLIPRGVCSFEQKVINAQFLGAEGVIIYGTLGSRYTWNETSSSQDFPVDKHDYDCDYGETEIDSTALSLNPYDSSTNDDLLGDGSNDLCVVGNNDFNSKCASRRCLLTGKENKDSNGMMQACCAWDLHIWLWNDPSVQESYPNDRVNIPAIYITMEEFSTIKTAMSSGGATLTMYARYRSSYNVSAIVVWAVGVFVCWLASYLSASEYRNYNKDRGVSDAAPLYTELINNPGASNNNQDGELSVETSSPPVTEQLEATSSDAASPTPYHRQESYNDETLELRWQDAIIFLVFSSASLFILFFFKLYSVVKVMYGFGCSGALMQVIVLPLYIWISTRCSKHKTNGSAPNTKVLFTFLDEPVTLVNIFALITSYGIGITWIIVGFTASDPSIILFYWVLQDIMGACMCITFLGLIRLNSIKVASILLTAAFFYDIFFVFITPYFFQKSIMITVATSGGPPTADPTWCEKYPSDADCQGGDPLPMLFTIPRLGDYQGGASLLGLGDVVLPGLLLSLACRLDCAKRVVGLSSGGRGICTSPISNTSTPCCKSGVCSGYFYPVLVAYAVGLMLANMAVYLMKMGQPALLYLVPCCLGTMCFIAWSKGEMRDLWEGPKVLVTADRITGSNGGLFSDGQERQDSGEEMSHELS
eukprot:CAMPEP_0195509108 /NCGR_PEP_ID=MMETSP0794_2-20130614/2133_1 /TAXON_ID=515487 /ORGANISM="Stephanopyxis turris, Strain CCMP 815" /LENGTH=685 /DNA_ID=CAMNT_0040636243 /DNA_START=250 /DNA_END=2307 /DNA_ORIENTATION=-